MFILFGWDKASWFDIFNPGGKGWMGGWVKKWESSFAE
jgi:hypothetical protein